MTTQSLVEAFLLIEQPRQRLGHWTTALAALDSPLAPPVAAINAYYDPTCDQALLNLLYDPIALGDAQLGFVVDVALLAEVGMVQPAALSEGERVRFLSTRLQRCTIRVTSQRSAVSALTELVRRIKDDRSSSAGPRSGAESRRGESIERSPRKPEAPKPPPIPTAAKARSVAPRGDTVDAPPAITARGTRDALEKMTNADADAMLAPPPLEPPPLEPPPLEPAPAVEAMLSPPTSSRHVIARVGRSETKEMHPLVVQQLSARELPDYDECDDRATAPMDLAKLRALVAAADDKARAHLVAREVVRDTGRTDSRAEPSSRNIPRFDEPSPRDARPETLPESPSAAARRSPRPQSEPYIPSDQRPDIIYARYLRGGRWIPVRVGALSLKGAALLTGALPRLHDRVDIALAFGSRRALVRGSVAKVSTMREAAISGAATFTVGFQLDATSRKQLTELLLAAREAKVTIKPPPARATRRFPVEWQMTLGRGGGPVEDDKALKVTALDVSIGGMFVRSPHVALELDSVVSFLVVLDDGSSAISGRAKIVRAIDEAEARACGLSPGYGLGIIEMSEPDRMRWLGFLARIERRAEKRVLIGAEPARLAELQAGLASLGYTVVGGTDPGMLVQLANTDARPADAVLIDADWLQNEASTSLVENLFSQRNVPCVTMHAEPKRARQAIDRLLEVVV